MSYNGSGTFIINTTGQPVVSGTVISSTVFNTLTTDLANGLSTAITKDGQTTVTNNIPLNGYKITNLGAGTVSTDAVQLGQLQSGSFSLVTVTGTDTYVGSMTPILPAYTAGNFFTFVVPNTNTGPATLNINSLGAKVLSRDGSTALAAGDLVAGSEVAVVYDGTRFQVLNSNSKTDFTVSNNATLSNGTANGVAYLNGSKVVTSGSNLTYDGTTTLAVKSAAAATATLTLYGNAGSSGLVLQGGSDTNGYISTQNSMYFSTNSISRGNINTTGNWTINAPTSGTALTVKSTGAGIAAIAVTGVAAFDAYADYAGNGNTTLSTSFTVGQAASNDAYVYQRANASLIFGTNSANRMVVGAGGNVTINAPTSGAALTVGGASAAAAGIFNSGSQIGIQINAASTITGVYTSYAQAGTIGAYIGIGSSVITGATSSDLGITSNGGNIYFGRSAGSAIAMQVANAGNVTINAPSSGAALTVNGIAGNQYWITSSARGAGNNYQSWYDSTGRKGYIGYGASDDSFFIANEMNAQMLFQTNAATRLTIAAAGNVSIAAPTSGATLTLNAFNSIAVINAAAQSTFNCSIALQSAGKSAYQIYASGSADELRIYNGTSDVVKIATAGNVTFNGSAATTPVAVTFSATAMTVDCRLSNVFTTTFTANVTTAPTVSNPQDGQTINWFITQDATGSRTMTWPTSFKWPNGTAGVLSTAANAVDLLVATYRSSTGFWYASLAKGFA